MALSQSNTFHIPNQQDSIALSRTYWNNSFKAVLQNFASANAIPITTNINYEGATQSPPDGMLYFNSTTGALYLRNSAEASGPYGSFRRLGLGTRAYSNLASAASDEGTLDVGELLVVVNDTAGSANNRLYLVSDTNKTIIDVGIPGDRSVANTSIIAKTITGFEIADGTITSDHIANGTVIAADVADESITDSKLDSSLLYLALVM